MAISTAVAVTVAVVLFLFVRSGHRRAPSPRGMVFRAEAREVVEPRDRFDVRVTERSGRAVAIFAPAIGEFPATLEIHGFPEGDCREVLAGADAERVWGGLASIPGKEGSAATFDFDGDGTTDGVVTGTGPEHGVVRIVSGRDHRVLFEDDDPLEYENGDRGIPLGDIDEDGCSELALLHPRKDRSAYDLEFRDRIFGAKSWVTVVSGARATR